MRKIFYILILAATAGIWSFENPTVSISETVPQSISRLQSANVKIINISAGYIIGSGTHIKINNKDYILTVAHLFNKIRPKRDLISVIANDLGSTDYTKFKEATLVAIDRKTDLALIKINRNWKTAYLTIADKTPELFDPVWMVGNPGGLNDFIEFGKILIKKRTTYILDGKTYFGDSGGAVVNGSSEIVGVNDAILLPQWRPFLQKKSRIVFLSECINLRAIRKFINDYKGGLK